MQVFEQVHELSDAIERRLAARGWEPLQDISVGDVGDALPRKGRRRLLSTVWPKVCVVLDGIEAQEDLSSHSQLLVRVCLCNPSISSALSCTISMNAAFSNGSSHQRMRSLIYTATFSITPGNTLPTSRIGWTNFESSNSNSRKCADSSTKHIGTPSFMSTMSRIHHIRPTTLLLPSDAAS